jgi:hypothetical protein
MTDWVRTFIRWTHLLSAVWFYAKLHYVSHTNHPYYTIWATSRQNQHNGFATSMDPDQPAHPCSLIRIHDVRLQTLLQVEKVIANSMDPDQTARIRSLVLIHAWNAVTVLCNQCFCYLVKRWYYFVVWACYHVQFTSCLVKWTCWLVQTAC